jgi:hypothetical protein
MSILDLDLPAIAAKMPVIGMNRSWHALETPWRCFIDPPNWTDIRGGIAPRPDLAIFPVPQAKSFAGVFPEIPGQAICPVNHLPILVSGERRFMGFELGKGTYGFNSGLFTLEVATWAGHNPIHLLGYDNCNGHFFDPRFVNNDKTFETWGQMLEQAAVVLKERGVRVVNCSPISTISVFEEGVA